ncbi:MAG: ROK family protein [Arachnia sp.]
MLLSQLDPSSRRIVETVLRFGPLARAEMVERIGLSSGSLTRLTGPLISAGILREGEVRATSIGRPRQPLDVVDDAARFLGVKVVRGRIYATLVGLSGVVHGTADAAADTGSAETTAAAVAELLERHAPAWAPEAIGVSLAAAVDADGNARAAGFLGWAGGNIVRAVQDAAGLPCAAANDVDALTLAEHWFGHGRGTHNFVVLTVGAGVGSGAIVDDTLLGGHLGFAALLGRAWLSDGTNVGELLSTEPLVARASAAAGRPLSPDDLLSDDPAVGAVLDAAAEGLGELVALAMIAYGPERVLIAGEGVPPFVGRAAAIRAGMLRHSYDGDQLPELVLGEGLDFLDWARGGAALAIRHVLR